MRTQSADTRPEAERVLIELIRNAPIAKRFRFVQTWSASLVEAGMQAIQATEPAMSETEARLRYAERYYGKECIDEVRSALQRQQATVASQPDFQAALLPLVETLEQHHVTYALSGSVARSLYGMQRAAFQIDLLADGDQQFLVTFAEQHRASYLLCQKATPVVPSCGRAFTLMHLPSLLPVVVVLPSSSSEQAMLNRAQSLVLIAGSCPVHVIAPEDAVLLALREYQESDETADDVWLDVLGILKVQGKRLNLLRLASEAEHLQMADLWQQALSDAGLQEAPSREAA